MHLNSLNLDTIIFFSFLIINLGIGLFYGRNIKTIREYAIGNQSFSTGTIAATLVATWIGGGFFSMTISKTYSDGLYFLVPSFGDVIAFLIIALLFGPRMERFLGKLSVAEAMGDLYGKNIRIITSIVGVIKAIGGIAVQFKVAGTILGYFFNFSTLEMLILSSTIITIYSAFGGIKAVTFTDIIQFFTFGVFIPILALMIWGTLDNPDKIVETLSTNPLFDYNKIIDFNNTKFIATLSLLMYFSIPGLNPAIFQRIAMASSTRQVTKSFLIAALVCFFLEVSLCWVGILLLSHNPNLDPTTLTNYIISTYAYPGLKGFILVGIMSMIMSTADSHINAASVLFGNDFLKPLGIKWKENNLIPYNIFAVIMGCGALILAVFAKSILEILLMTASIYMPIVTVPLTLGVFGFRTSSKSILIGISVAIVTVIYWELTMKHTGLDSLVPGMIASLVVIIVTHYGLKQPGGFEKTSFAKGQKNFFIQKILSYIKNFNLLKFCENNNPKNEATYSYFGLFSIVSVFSTMYSLPLEVRHEYSDMLEVIYHSVLISSTIFLSFPIWPPTFKKQTFINIFWIIGMFYIPVFVGSLLVIISNYGQLQSMIFMVNLIMTAILMRWHLAIFIIFTGVFTASEFFRFYTGSSAIFFENQGLQFKIMYTLLMVTSILIAFLKPNQYSLEISEFRNNDLESKSKLTTFELIEALETKKEVLKNLSHEIRSPVHSVSNILETLNEHWDHYTEEQKKDFILLTTQTSERLSSLVNSILDYSNLNDKKVGLQIEEVNFIEVINNLIEECKILYLNGKKIEFALITNTSISKFFVDKALFIQAIRNLIMNAIQYSNSGIITVSISEADKETLEFIVSDEGVGIPTGELDSIFESFTQSSRTKTMAGGRGIGLTLVKKIVKEHLGDIYARNNHDKGASFILKIPKDLSKVSFKLQNIEQSNPIFSEDETIELALKNIFDEERNQMVTRLVNEGESLEFIANVTELTIEEVEKLKKNLM